MPVKEAHLLVVGTVISLICKLWLTSSRFHWRQGGGERERNPCPVLHQSDVIGVLRIPLSTSANSEFFFCLYEDPIHINPPCTMRYHLFVPWAFCRTAITITVDLYMRNIGSHNAFLYIPPNQAVVVRFRGGGDNYMYCSCQVCVFDP